MKKEDFNMKWPIYLVMMRHDVSNYNLLRSKKLKDPQYVAFLEEFEKDPFSKKTKKLANVCWKKFKLSSGDHNTPLADPKSKNAEKVGVKLKAKLELPDIIFVSPYNRTLGTFEGLKRGWPELKKVEFVIEERIREQGHGMALLYNDSKIFQALNPEQKMLMDLEGPYWYKYPQGEDIPDVRIRNHSWTGTVIREFKNKKVLSISHHVNILATRANWERWSPEKFIEVNSKERPINCGVTIYRGHPNLGGDGKLILERYNEKLF